MLSLRRNVLANAAGQFVGILTSLMVVPVYARLLGAEGFGVIGLITSLQAMAAMFDLGFSATANREVSRSTVGAGAPLGDIVRTLEFVYLGTGAVILLLLWGGSGWVANHWIVANELSAGTLERAFSLAAVVVSFRFAQVLYHGVLRGLEHQLFLNVFVSVSAAVQAAVLIGWLVLFRPGLPGFLLVQALLAVAELALLRSLCWRQVRAGRTSQARFRWQILIGLWKYALGVNVVTILATGVKQIDKLVLSKLLPIQYSGYYAAATLIGTGLGKLGVPLQVAAFPRFSKLVALHRWTELAGLVRRSVRVTTILTATTGCGIAWFSHELLLVWTGSVAMADGGAAALSIIAVAMVLNTIMGIVFGLILATGATSISMYMNLAGLVVLLPTTYLLVSRDGIRGAAMSWLAFNVAYYLCVPWFVARRVPGFHPARFFLVDSLPYIVVAALAYGLLRMVMVGRTELVALAGAVVAGGLLIGVAIWVTPDLKATALGILRNFRGRAA